MFQYQCLNPISKVGLDGFTNDYTKTEEIEKAQNIGFESKNKMNWNLIKI